jgi:hypothetical protein
MKMENVAHDLLELLRLALPIVERIAGTSPTEMLRMQRQQEAVKLAAAIRAAIARADAVPA